MRRLLSALGVLSVVALSASTSAQQSDPLRPAPWVGPPAPVIQDMSWYPHDVAPPFRSELVEPGDDRIDVMHAGSAVFSTEDDVRLPAALVKPLLNAQGRFEPGWFLVHFEGEITARDKAWLDQVSAPVTRGDGSAVSRWYVPNNAYAVWVDDLDTYGVLEEHVRVDYVGRYQPAYKLDPRIGTIELTSAERVGRPFYRLDVDLMPGHPAAQVAADVRALGAAVLTTVELRGARTYDVRFLVVDAAPALVTQIARIEGVRMVQERGDGVAMYGDLSGGGKLQARNLFVDDQANSPIVTASRFPLWVTHDLQGQGQLIGVVDSALDWNNTGVNGCGFGYPDTNIDNWGFALPNLSRLLLNSVGPGGVNLKVPRADVLGGAALQSTVGNEHGTAAAGSALGDFYGNNDTKWWEHDVDNWESWAPSNFSGLLGPGTAHEAQLYFTPVMNGPNFRWEFAGEFETNMNTTLNNMAAAGVVTTNHSVGIVESSNTYTQTTIVHDTNGFDHQDMLQFMAAGNDGAVSNALTSQAVAKNGVAVGASDDVLNPEARITFSSIGPRFDGAIKPDIMVPGNDATPRDGGNASLLILPDSNGSSSASCEYQWTAGTSFAAPSGAGAGALVHQYFEEGRYPGTQPLSDASAALIKAMLVNAGHRLTGANLGNGQYPNSYQGWGEPNLSHVLDFGSGRDLIVVDVPSAAGFQSSGEAVRTETFTVDSSAERLRVTLVWTDEPGSAGTGKKLINDLDLRVVAPGGATYRGNVINGSTGLSTTGGSADTLNNVENVIINNPSTGAWTATVDPGVGNYSVGQGYALVITGLVTEGGGGGGPQPPVADFSGSPTSGTAPLTVDFTSLASGDIDTHAWSFGDGGSSNATNPSHTYTSPGTYNVSLTVTGPGGSDGETKNGYITVDSPPTGGGDKYYISFLTTTTVPGLGNVADDDVVTYDPSTGDWAMYFDGSDVGIGGTDINALHVLDTGDLVMSFNSSTFAVPGLVGGPNGTTVEDSDLVIFSFTSSGANTSGSFQFIFDGSDVGLTTNGEDIDGIYEFPDGGLGISTLGSANVSGLSGVRDEDVMFFSATQYGSTTVGSFSAYFDGSDVGFSTNSGEDLSAVTFDGGVDLLFSTVGDWSAAGGAGTDEDVGRFSGTFGSATSGSASLELDLSALGIAAGEDIDGLYYGP